MPLPRPPNQEILEHEAMRKIDGKLFDYNKKLEKENYSKDEIKSMMDKQKDKLMEQFQKDKE